MSASSKLLAKSYQQQESFYNDFEEDREIVPEDLSGDEKTQASLLVKDESNKANFALSAATIIKTVVGSGILTMPYVVSKCGVVFAIIVFAIASVLTQFSATSLLKAKNLSGHSNYATILYHIFQNRRAKVLGLVWTAFGNFGVCVAEIIIFKQTIRKIFIDVFPSDSSHLQQFYTSELFLALIFAVLQTPFLLTRKIEKMRFLAFMGVNGIIVFVFAFIAHFIIVSVDNIAADKPRGSMNAFPTDWFQAFGAVPNVIYALVFMFNFFPIYKGMRKATDHKMKKVSIVSILICSCFYLTIGILGYDLVGNVVINGNFLETLPYVTTDSAIYYVINCSFLLSVYFSFPIMFFGSRNNFVTLSDLLFTAIQNPQNGSQNTTSYYVENDRTINVKNKYGRIFVLKTSLIFLVVVIVGIFSDDIAVVYNAVGAICATSSGFLLPCGFYIMLVRKKKKQKRASYYIAVSIFIFMIPFALFTIVANYLPE